MRMVGLRLWGRLIGRFEIEEFGDEYRHPVLFGGIDLGLGPYSSILVCA